MRKRDGPAVMDWTGRTGEEWKGWLPGRGGEWLGLGLCLVC